MPVLLAPPRSLASPSLGHDLINQVFPAAPGTLARLDRGTNLLFAGCGEGEALIEIARIFPRSCFLGLERSAGAFGAARTAVHKAWLQNTGISPDTARQPHLQGIFDLVIRRGGDDGAPMDALPTLLRDGGLLFDLADEPLSPADYHDAGFVILRALTLSDGSRCTIAGNWILSARSPRT